MEAPMQYWQKVDLYFRKEKLAEAIHATYILPLSELWVGIVSTLQLLKPSYLQGHMQVCLK